MPGLRKLPPAHAISAMNSINMAAPSNPQLMLVLFGTGIVCVLVMIAGLQHKGDPAAVWQIAGAALYLVSVLILVGYQVPPNDQLIKVDPNAAGAPGIRVLPRDDLILPIRRITSAGHPRRLGELTHRGLQAWLGPRRATWPHTPNRHVLISAKTALGTGPVSRGYLNRNLQRRGVSIERIRRDRVLHEALTARADPLHLAWYSACPRPPPASTPSSPAISSPARRPALTR